MGPYVCSSNSKSSYTSILSITWYLQCIFYTKKILYLLVYGLKMIWFSPNLAPQFLDGIRRPRCCPAAAPIFFLLAPRSRCCLSRASDRRVIVFWILYEFVVNGLWRPGWGRPRRRGSVAGWNLIGSRQNLSLQELFDLAVGDHPESTAAHLLNWYDDNIQAWPQWAYLD